MNAIAAPNVYFRSLATRSSTGEVPEALGGAIDASKAKAGAELTPKRLLTKSGSVFVSLGQGDDGELYIVSIGGGIYHIVAKPK